MSDYHILGGEADGNSYQVVFHVPVPIETNQVGYALRQALVEHLRDTASGVPFIASAEQTQLDDGELYEHSWGYATHPGVALAGKRDELDAKFAQFEVAVLNQIRQRLAYWGFSRDVS